MSVKQYLCKRLEEELKHTKTNYKIQNFRRNHEKDS